MSFLGVCFVLLLIAVFLVGVAFHGRIRDVEDSLDRLWRTKQSATGAKGSKAPGPGAGIGIVS